MTESPYSDLERPPLSERALSRALTRDGGLWREIRVVMETGSTNADLAAAARGGAAEGTVLVAEGQTAGRGRLGRAWQAPPRSGLTFSMLLRPRVPPGRHTWLPLLTGVAVAEAVGRMTGFPLPANPDFPQPANPGRPLGRAEAGRFGGAAGEPAVRAALKVRTVLKWPNDVLVGERKLAGILVERAAGAVIVGVGLNVSLRGTELPVPSATSLLIENAAWTDRDPLLRAILREFERWYAAWRSADGDPEACGLRAAYRAACATLGREVRVALPGEEVLTGVAHDIDTEGRLLVGTPSGDRAVSAGDVVHVRAGA
jgi:BirA family biotin operon repressor/biotin-[acetyl-CoA-carboxylase] ligase